MWDIVGHDWAIALLQQNLALERITQSYLCVGPPRIGKTLLGQKLAQALNCSQENPPCGECRSCTKIERQIHPDVRLIEPEGGTLKIAQIRELQHEAILAPYEGDWRVIILAEFQQATPEAANCLLKTLEEPPTHLVLILTATDTSALLPTIVSRCQVLSLRPPSISQIQEALIERDIPLEKARLLAHLSEGRIGWAIEAADNPDILETRQKWLRFFQTLPAKDLVKRFHDAEQLDKTSTTVLEQLKLWVSWWRDILLIQSDCQELVTNIDHLEELEAQAGMFRLLDSQAFLQHLYRTRTELERNANSRLALEVLFMDCPSPASRTI
jgi:DNA polymerase-3 subunit delta'